MQKSLCPSRLYRDWVGRPVIYSLLSRPERDEEQKSRVYVISSDWSAKKKTLDLARWSRSLEVAHQWRLSARNRELDEAVFRRCSIEESTGLPPAPQATFDVLHYDLELVSAFINQWMKMWSYNYCQSYNYEQPDLNIGPIVQVFSLRQKTLPRRTFSSETKTPNFKLMNN